LGRQSGEERDIVFFAHGYNTDPVEALKRQRLVEREMHARGFDCIVVGFDWPTGGTAVSYLYDRLEATRAARLLVEDGIFPFISFSRRQCPVRVHVLAHSMGCYVIREAFRAARKSRRTDIPDDWRVGQVVFFAADISSRSFGQNSTDMFPVFDHCGRLTNYFSGYDEALAVSNAKNLDISSRVGRVGMPPDRPPNPKAVDVDCGPRYRALEDRTFAVIEGMVSHAWYMEDGVWYDDLAHTLRGVLDRGVIPTRSPAPGGAVDEFVLNTR
jgi:esterase/lipase superfamily enzyme